MKGMQKIKRGNNFKGVLEYAFDRDKNEEKTPGHIIGGNMAGTNTRELTREFLRFCDARPDVEKPVWHNSLRLPEGEHLTDEKWNEIGFDYVKRLGFNEDLNQFIFIKHDDKEGEHIHIIGSRVDMLGNLYLGKNENVISTRVISELERDHELTITKNLDYTQDDQGNYYIAERSPGRGRLLSRSEEKMQDRKQWNDDINYLAPKQRLVNAIENTLTNVPTTEEFIKGLEAENIKVMCVVKQGQMVGFSFEIDGENFKGSQVGANWKELTNPNERTLDYEQERDAEIIGSRKYAASRKPARGTEQDSEPTSKSTKEPRKLKAVSDTPTPERDSRGRFKSGELEHRIDERATRQPDSTPGQSDEPHLDGYEEAGKDDAGRWGISDSGPTYEPRLQLLPEQESNGTTSESRQPAQSDLQRDSEALIIYVADLDNEKMFNKALHIEGLEEPELTMRKGLLTDLKKENCPPWIDPILATSHVHKTNIMAFSSNSEFVGLTEAMIANQARAAYQPPTVDTQDWESDLTAFQKSKGYDDENLADALGDAHQAHLAKSNYKDHPNYQSTDLDLDR